MGCNASKRRRRRRLQVNLVLPSSGYNRSTYLLTFLKSVVSNWNPSVKAISEGITLGGNWVWFGRYWFSPCQGQEILSSSSVPVFGAVHLRPSTIKFQNMFSSSSPLLYVFKTWRVITGTVSLSYFLTVKYWQ